MMDEKALKQLEKLHRRAVAWEEDSYDAGVALIGTVPEIISALRAAWAQAEEARRTIEHLTKRRGVLNGIISQLQRENEVYRRMLDPIFEAYERMGSSEQDYAQKDRDILEAVKAAHMLIGQLRGSNSSTPHSGEEEA